MAALNGRWHRVAMIAFLGGVLAHQAEHAVQAFQLYVLDMPVPAARGVLGEYWPALVASEGLHYAFALFTLTGLILLRPGIHGRARVVWNVALAIQMWHHFEHALLLFQATFDVYFFGAAKPMSVLQLFVRRPELHLLYNSLVTVPHVIGMVLHRRHEAVEASPRCECGDALRAREPSSSASPAPGQTG